MRRDKIRTIENLDLLPALTKLSLPCHVIERLDGVVHAVHLQTLILSHNRIKKIDILDRLVHLRVVDLSSNLIGIIPQFSNLKVLHTMALSDNRISEMNELRKFKRLPNLSNLSLRGNPVSEQQHTRSFVIYNVQHLDILDDTEIDCQERQQSVERFHRLDTEDMEEQLKRSQESVANLQSMLDEKNRTILNMAEQLTQLESKLLNVRKENEDKTSTISELESILKRKSKQLSQTEAMIFKMQNEIEHLRFAGSGMTPIQPRSNYESPGINPSSNKKASNLVHEVSDIKTGVHESMESSYIEMMKSGVRESEPSPAANWMVFANGRKSPECAMLLRAENNLSVDRISYDFGTCEKAERAMTASDEDEQEENQEQVARIKLVLENLDKRFAIVQNEMEMLNDRVDDVRLCKKRESLQAQLDSIAEEREHCVRSLQLRDIEMSSTNLHENQANAAAALDDLEAMCNERSEHFISGMWYTDDVNNSELPVKLPLRSEGLEEDETKQIFRKLEKMFVAHCHDIRIESMDDIQDAFEKVFVNLQQQDKVKKVKGVEEAPDDQHSLTADQDKSSNPMTCNPDVRDDEIELLRSIIAAKDQRLRALECLQDKGVDNQVHVASDWLQRKENDENEKINQDLIRLSQEYEQLTRDCQQVKDLKAKFVTETEVARSQYERASKILFELQSKIEKKTNAVKELEKDERELKSRSLQGEMQRQEHILTRGTADSYYHLRPAPVNEFQTLRDEIESCRVDLALGLQDLRAIIEEFAEGKMRSHVQYVISGFKLSIGQIVKELSESRQDSSYLSECIREFHRREAFASYETVRGSDPEIPLKCRDMGHSIAPACYSTSDAVNDCNRHRRDDGQDVRCVEHEDSESSPEERRREGQEEEREIAVLSSMVARSAYEAEVRALLSCVGDITTGVEEILLKSMMEEASAKLRSEKAFESHSIATNVEVCCYVDEINQFVNDCSYLFKDLNHAMNSISLDLHQLHKDAEKARVDSQGVQKHLENVIGASQRLVVNLQNEVLEKKEMKDKLAEEVHVLQARLLQVQEVFQLETSKTKEIEEQVNELTSPRVQRLLDSCQTSLESFSVFLQEKQELAERISHYTNVKSALEKDIIRLGQETSLMKSDFQIFCSFEDDCSRVLDEYEIFAESLESQILAISDKFLLVKQAKSVLSDSLASSRREYLLKNSELHELSSAVREKQKEKEQLELEVERKERLITAAEHKMQEEQVKLDNIKDGMSDLTVQLASLHKDVNSLQVCKSSLKRENEALLQQNEKLQLDLRATTEQQEEMVSQLHTLRAAREEIVQRISTLQGAQDDVERGVEGMDEQMASLLRLLSPLHVQIASLNARMEESFRAKEEDFVARLAVFTREISGRRDEHMRLKNLLQCLQVEQEESGKAIDTVLSSIGDVERQLDMDVVQIRRFVSMKGELIRQLNDLVIALDEERNQLQVAGSEISAIFLSASEESRQMCAQEREGQRAWQELNAQICSREKMFESLNDAIADTEGALLLKENKLEENKKELVAQEEKLLQVMEEIYGLKCNQEEENSHLNAVRKELKKARLELDVVQQERDDLQIAVVQTQNMVNDLEKSLVDLHAQREHHNNMLTSLSSLIETHLGQVEDKADGLDKVVGGCSCAVESLGRSISAEIEHKLMLE
eukprot:130231-Hanusia_phi.AAC.1